MFYSQFILAKKGPLGTIWIAAHLERKLRKNQVTDTDIGVSVDSILFPDVPIALRLSSHLLLGVVRIYNRKVNYLFDDCSEALLKVKQAFRSAAVDLPPEESKAPYHSITLPETFDLDDFELPENEILQGNYVDHHVSSREQITLQDTMDGVVYSTSQFGLDERFGDGETSQIGLDLEEELFLDKDATVGDTIFSKSDPQGSDETTTIIKNDVRDSVAMQVDDYGDQEPACDDHVEPEDQDLIEPAAAESGENIPNKPEHQTGEKIIVDRSLDNDLNNDSIPDTPHENGCHSGDIERELRNSQNTPEFNAMDVADGALIGLDGHNSVENNGGLKSVDRTDGEFAESPSCSNVTYDNNEDAGRQTTSNYNLVPVSEGDLDNEQATVKQADLGETTSPCGPTIVDDETQACLEQKNSVEEVSSARTHVLQPCTLRHDQPDISSLEGEQSEGLPTMPSEEKAEGCNNMESEPILSEKIQEDGGNSDQQLDNVLSCNNQSENSNDHGTSDLPAPEQLLSVPEGDINRPDNLLVGPTPDKEVAVETDGLSTGTKLISGRKRNYTESTLTVESINSVESFGQTRPKRTADSVPDDDDLLSSILVGRRSSVLKMKPTPAFEVASAKRTRTATRPSVSKRKVLMDDIMVLLGDTIRQHLTDTEDIRRVRKKAPCTRPEIAMIQRQFLEEEIFRETIFTGTSAVLGSLHSGTYDLSGITISEVDENHSSAEVAKDTEFSVRLDIVNETGAEALVHGGHLEEQSAGAPPHIDGAADLTESLQNEPLNEAAEMEIDERTAEIADAANPSALDELLSPIDPNQTLNTQAVDGIEVLAPEVENVVAVESDTKAGDDFLVEEDKPSASVDIDTDVQPECTLRIENGDNSIEASYLETGEFPNGDQTADEFRTNKVGEPNDDLTKDDMELEGKDPTDEAKVDSVLAVELDNGVKGSSSDGEKPAVHDAEVTAQESENVVIANNTDFLNVDDEFAEDDDEGMQDGEENGILDNSGWSSRTRAVAKYLQNLFDNEAVQGKKVLVVDGLLSGKTRKEASRMFFETLVLKTKDYIQVEQPRPYDNISVKPRGKLMKSDF